MSEEGDEGLGGGAWRTPTWSKWRSAMWCSHCFHQRNAHAHMAAIKSNTCTRVLLHTVDQNMHSAAEWRQLGGGEAILAAPPTSEACCLSRFSFGLPSQLGR